MVRGEAKRCSELRSVVRIRVDVWRLRLVYGGKVGCMHCRRGWRDQGDK